tara:strand:- start:135 stop:353 length:219 start_codon:yes stop_codon:yes gene_type:complete
MKNIIWTPTEIKEVDYTAEETAQAEADAITVSEMETQAQANKEAKEDLKASAKAKLIAGEPLTEDEANTIVL